MRPSKKNDPIFMTLGEVIAQIHACGSSMSYEKLLAMANAGLAPFVHITKNPNAKAYNSYIILRSEFREWMQSQGLEVNV